VLIAYKGRAGLVAALGDIEGAGSGNVIALTTSVFAVIVNVLGTMGFFAASVAALALLDVLFSQSGRIRRLIEFAAYAYLPTVVWGVISLTVLLIWWTPAQLRVPSFASPDDFPALLATHQANLQASPIQITLRIVASYFWAWRIAIQVAALRVVSGFSVLGTWVSGVVLIGIFVILPWLIG
jgi:hypothetical protein